MPKYILAFLIALFLPLAASASILGVQQGGTAVSSTSAKVAYYVDGNRGDTYTADGSILSPYKSVSTLLAGLWTGAAGYAFNLDPAIYVDGASDTFPNVPFYLSGNESTLVEPSGVTFPNSFDIYDLSIIGNVHESDNSLTTIHQFNNGLLNGNVQVDGNATANGMAILGGQYLWSSPGSLTNIEGSFIQNPIWADGVVNINDDQIATSSAQYAITATTTAFLSNGQFANLNLLGATIINTGTGGAINTSNGATSTTNNLTAFTSLTAVGAPSVTAGNAATVVCDFQTYNVTGSFVAPTGTNWKPCYDEQLNVLNGATTTSLGITGLANPAGKFLAVDPLGNIIATTTPATGTVISVSGTTNQITSSGGTTPTLSLPNLVLFPVAASSTLLSVFNTAYFGGTATTSINSAGTITGVDADNIFTGIITPTRNLTIPFATSTAIWTGTSTQGVDIAPGTVATFAGTIKTVQCNVNTFLGVNIQVNTTSITPSYFVASSTVGKEVITANNTFTAGQIINVLVGTTTSATASSGVANGSCTLQVVQTS